MPDDEQDPIWGSDEPEIRSPLGENSPLRVVGENKFHLRPARLPDPRIIRPRPWLYGRHMLRGYITMLVSPGGVGKTSYAMGVAMSLCLGRSLFGEQVYRQCNVAYLNLEDDMEELDRRLAALHLLYNIPKDELRDRFFLYSADEGKVTIATASEDGTEIVHPHESAIIREIKAHNIGAFFVDPYVETHDLSENNNGEMNKAMGAWRRVGRRTGCATQLIHHTRKGAGNDVEASRGAKAMTDAARVGLLLSSMTEEEAQGFDVPPEDRERYFRVDDVKANMSAKVGVARWFEKVDVALGNTTSEYPDGDVVGAVQRWFPPSVMGNLTDHQCNEALTEIGKGIEDGVLYSGFKSGRSNRWAGTVLIEHFGCSETRAAAILSKWLKEGLLVHRDYEDKKQRKSRLGLFVVDAKRPGTVVK